MDTGENWPVNLVSLGQHPLQELKLFRKRAVCFGKRFNLSDCMQDCGVVATAKTSTYFRQ